MQGCSFKMVRQELPECTQRQSCSQDGETEGAGENRGKHGPFSDVENDERVFPRFCRGAVRLNFFIM